MFTEWFFVISIYVTMNNYYWSVTRTPIVKSIYYFAMCLIGSINTITMPFYNNNNN